MRELTFRFEGPDGDRARECFWGWFQAHGEQEYWEAMRYHEEDEEGDITGLRFDLTDAGRGTVKVRCGRFTGEPTTEPYKEEDHDAEA